MSLTMTQPRPIQFGLRTILVLMTVAGVLLWLARQEDVLFPLLGPFYLLVGYAQAVFAAVVRRGLEDSREGQTSRQQAFNLAGLSCYFLLVTWCVYVGFLAERKLHDLAPALHQALSELLLAYMIVVYACVGIVGCLAHVPAFLMNIVSMMVYCRPVADWPLTALQLLNLANSVILVTALST